MAEAYAKLTGRCGVAMVTRGPGACHGAIGVHTARQDGTPLVMFVGQIPTSERPQNLAFGGPNKKTLYLCGRTALFKVQMLAQGYTGRPK